MAVKSRHASGARLVGHAVSSVMLRVAVRTRIKARFAGKGGSLVKKRNAESRGIG